MNEHARNAKARPACERGFTFVELVVVLAIAGVLAAVAASRWNATSATAPYQGELLARSIRHMQMLAMTWGSTLLLTPASGGYSVSCASAGTPACASGPGTPVTDPASGAPFRVVLSYGVTLTGPALYLDSLGRPVSSAGTLLSSATVYTMSAGTQTWSVSVAPITGFVTVATP